MKGNELVWRALADRALEGQRTWRNVADLAYEAGVPSTTAYLALERLESNGTIDRYSRGGLAVVSIDKLLTMLCAWRNLERDTLAWTTREGIGPVLDSKLGPYARGERDPERPSRRGLQRTHRVPARVRESHLPARRQGGTRAVDGQACGEDLERVLESCSDVCRSLRDSGVAVIRVSERLARQLRAGPRVGSGR